MQEEFLAKTEPKEISPEDVVSIQELGINIPELLVESLEAKILDRLELEQALKILRSSNPKLFEVIIKIFLNEMSLEDISKEYGVAYQSARNWREQGLQKLKTILEDLRVKKIFKPRDPAEGLEQDEFIAYKNLVSRFGSKIYTAEESGYSKALLKKLEKDQRVERIDREKLGLEESPYHNLIL